MSNTKECVDMGNIRLLRHWPKLVYALPFFLLATIVLADRPHGFNSPKPDGRKSPPPPYVYKSPPLPSSLPPHPYVYKSPPPPTPSPPYVYKSPPAPSDTPHHPYYHISQHDQLSKPKASTAYYYKSPPPPKRY
nr:hypothetical protein [Tanacetum cinerariifolium]